MKTALTERSIKAIDAFFEGKKGASWTVAIEAARKYGKDVIYDYWRDERSAHHW